MYFGLLFHINPFFAIFVIYHFNDKDLKGFHNSRCDTLP